MRDRRDAEFRAATWDEALDRVASGLRDAQERSGPDAAGLFGGGGVTNEKAYQAGKFVRVALRSAAIDYNGRFCMSSAANAAQGRHNHQFSLADGSCATGADPVTAYSAYSATDDGGELVVTVR